MKWTAENCESLRRNIDKIAVNLSLPPWNAALVDWMPQTNNHVATIMRSPDLTVIYLSKLVCVNLTNPQHVHRSEQRLGYWGFWSNNFFLACVNSFFRRWRQSIGLFAWTTSETGLATYAALIDSPVGLFAGFGELTEIPFRFGRVKLVLGTLVRRFAQSAFWGAGISLFFPIRPLNSSSAICCGISPRWILPNNAATFLRMRGLIEISEGTWSVNQSMAAAWTASELFAFIGIPRFGFLIVTGSVSREVSAK